MDVTVGHLDTGASGTAAHTYRGSANVFFVLVRWHRQHSVLQFWKWRCTVCVAFAAFYKRVSPARLYRLRPMDICRRNVDTVDIAQYNDIEPYCSSCTHGYIRSLVTSPASQLKPSYSPDHPQHTTPQSSPHSMTPSVHSSPTTSQFSAIAARSMDIATRRYSQYSIVQRRKTI